MASTLPSFLFASPVLKSLATKALEQVVVSALLLGVLSPTASSASNTVFLPGDAYFSFELTEQPAATLEHGVATFDYFPLSTEATASFCFCDDFGYDKIKISDMPSTALDLLAETYQQVMELRAKRKTHESDNIQTEKYWKARYEREKYETRSLPGLIVNRDFDVQLVLNLRYNENGVPGIQSDESEEKSLYNQRNADRVPGLRCQAPAFRQDGFSQLPLTVSWRDLKIIVLDSVDYSGYLRRSEGFRFYVIADTIEVYEYRNSRAVQLP